MKEDRKIFKCCAICEFAEEYGGKLYCNKNFKYIDNELEYCDNFKES